MIEKMKVVSIVARDTQKEALLDGLKKLGLLHIREKQGADPAYLQRIADLSATELALKEYAPETPAAELLSDGDFEALYTQVQATLEDRQTLSTRRAALTTRAEALEKWGNFSPGDFDFLRENGIDLKIYRMDKKSLAGLSAAETPFIRLSPVEKLETVALWGPLPEGISADEFQIPTESLEQLQAQIESCDSQLADGEMLLRKAAAHIPSFQAQLLKAQNAMEYSSVRNTAASEGGLVWLTGYIPADNVEEFKTAAVEHRWAWAMDDPAEDDELVPTKVCYNKVTRLMVPIFDILGVLPGYREFDISFWFLAFFALFFAMILGDAGYGVLLLIGAIILTVKTRKPSDALLLLWVLSIATIVWGTLTGTWFGLEAAMKVPLLRSLTIPILANYPDYFGISATAQQNAIMKFCFILGTVQLSLACVMCIKRKLSERNLSLIADLGWLIAICAIYFLALYLVIGEDVPLAPVGACVGIGFVLVVLFGGMAPGKRFSQGLKDGLANAFTVFLNTISAFGNVMSYIRLFAVGMASLAIAQSFNNMAAGFEGPLLIVAALIMIVGHALNLVMGFLSVVVHGVRLNLLEFSGQLGMEWAGIAYEPFKNLDKIKK